MLKFEEDARLWFTSDEHFGHRNILKYVPARQNLWGDNVDAMTAALIKNFNATVGVDDLTIHMGDFSMNPSYLWVAGQLNGKHWLVPGNHDHIWPAHKKASKESTHARYNEAFNVVPKQMMVDLIGHKVLLSHLPHTGDAHGEDKHAQYRPRDDGTPIICGHVHDAWHTDGNQYNVGVDVNDFKPVHVSTIVEWLESL